ncbi:hypothetical protein ACOI9X_18650 [Pseudomonas sp. P2757]|uniref:hypothetical protein n=1 Tax=unclassified Pseudomonas TaxID=196821 RepID=UPI003B5B0D86
MTQITYPKAVNGRLNCASQPQTDGVLLEVGALVNAQDGAVIDIEGEGFTDSNGQIPIPNTKITARQFVNPDHNTHGFEQKLQGWDALKLMDGGFFKGSYKINGGSATSRLIAVSFKNAAGQYCDEI